MKCAAVVAGDGSGSRSPCGERGLKCACTGEKSQKARSLPVRGAWIEIPSIRTSTRPPKSLPVRGAWIEILGKTEKHCYLFGSLPVRGAWIEMDARPRAERITHGRSPCGERGLKCDCIADSAKQRASLPVRGAWIEIGTHGFVLPPVLSLPVRGAWIEISPALRSPCPSLGVAPRAGSVD